LPPPCGNGSKQVYEDKDMKSELGVSRALTWRYVIALLLVATLTTAAWISLRLVISEQKSTAAIVNVSGRQRMLSQRTALFSSLLVQAAPLERPGIRAKLREALALFERSHYGLLHGDAEMGLPATMSPTVRAMYFDGPDALDPMVAGYIRMVASLLAAPDEELTPDSATLRNIIALSPTTLVSALDRMVNQYQQEGEAAIGHLQLVETWVWLMTLVLLVLEASFIFKPFASRVQTMVGQLREARDTLEDVVRERTRDLETERRQLAESEEKFRLISTFATEAIVMIDTSGAIIFWNPAASKLFGHTAKEALGKDMHGLLAPPRRLADIGQGFGRFAASGEGPIVGKTVEMTALRKNGEEFPIELSVSALPLKERWHAIGIIRDITARKEHEEQLRSARESAEAANAAKTRFLATMSHEIRTPMNGILGMAQLLLRPEIAAAERQDFARTILNSGQTLLAVLNDILDLSKVEAGKLELESIVFDPQQLLHETRMLFAETARAKGLPLHSEWTSVSTLYRGDPHRLQQMLSNLTANAIKFTTEGVVTIVAHEIERNGASALLEFTVSDTGIGIAAEQQAQLFQPFAQADNSITRQFGGSGLGLSIVRNLANLMGGDVGFDSAPGQGSRFWFRIVADIVAPSEDLRGETNRAPIAPTTQTAPTPLSLPVAQPAGRILVVEDNATNRKLLQLLLQQPGIETVFAADGRQGVDLARTTAFDLVLMDIQMPLLDGYAATREIRQWEAEQLLRRLPIVALTADIFESDRRKCREAGMDDFLVKPIDQGELQQTLSRWLSAVPAIIATVDASKDSAIKAGNPLAAFDAPALLHALGGNREMALTIIDSAIGEFPEYFGRLEAAVEQGDWKEADRLTHTLKSLAGQVGGLRLAARFKGIDEKLGAGGRIDRSFLDSLREEFRQLQALLDDWKANEKV
jgi:PAS domain S-box-containing protein